jgi:hypothetical protein
MTVDAEAGAAGQGHKMRAMDLMTKEQFADTGPPAGQEYQKNLASFIAI